MFIYELIFCSLQQEITTYFFQFHCKLCWCFRDKFNLKKSIIQLGYFCLSLRAEICKNSILRHTNRIKPHLPMMYLVPAIHVVKARLLTRGEQGCERVLNSSKLSSSKFLFPESVIITFGRLLNDWLSFLSGVPDFNSILFRFCLLSH